MPAKIGITRLSVNDKRIEFLGCPSELLKDERPTLRGCLRFGMLIREHALANKQDKSVRDIQGDQRELRIFFLLKNHLKYK